MSRQTVFAVFAFGLVGCGGAADGLRPRDRPRAVQTVEMEEMRIRATGEGEDLRLEAYDAEQLFREGFRRQTAGECETALRFFDRVASEFPTSRFLAPALYDAALCLEEAGRWSEAADRYDRLVRDVPDSPDVKDALFRRGGCEEALEDGPRAEATFGLLLQREDLTPDERLEAKVRQGASLLAQDRLEECEEQMRQALSYFQRESRDQRIETDYFVAQAQYTLGEIQRIRFEQIRFTADEAEMRRDLDRKSRLLLDAQTEYILAIRVTNPHWAAASGYRIGEIFRDFYDHILAAPVPQELDAEQREIYFEELRNLIRPLVQKAIRVWERTILMSERTGIHNEWVDRTTQDLERLRRLIVEGTATAPPPESSAPPRPPARPRPQQDPGPVGSAPPIPAPPARDIPT